MVLRSSNERYVSCLELKLVLFLVFLVITVPEHSSAKFVNVVQISRDDADFFVTHA